MTKRDELERCDREIAQARAEVLAGNRELEGLLLCITDWAAERRLIEEEACHEP